MVEPDWGDLGQSKRKWPSTFNRATTREQCSTPVLSRKVQEMAYPKGQPVNALVRRDSLLDAHFQDQRLCL